MNISYIYDLLGSMGNHGSLDLRVTAVKSTWLFQVKSSRFRSKSPLKFSTQVAAKF